MENPVTAFTPDLYVHILRTQFDARVLGLTCRWLNTHLEHALLGFTRLDGWVRVLPNGIKHGASVCKIYRQSITYHYHLGHMKWRIFRSHCGPTRGKITDIAWIAPEGRPITVSYSHNDGYSVDSIIDDGHREWRLETRLLDGQLYVYDDIDRESEKNGVAYTGVTPQNIDEVMRCYNDAEAQASTLKPGYAWLKTRAVRAWVPPMCFHDASRDLGTKQRIRYIVCHTGGARIKPALRSRMIKWLEGKYTTAHAVNYVNSVLSAYAPVTFTRV